MFFPRPQAGPGGAIEGARSSKFKGIRGDWARFKAPIRGEVVQDFQSDTPKEYRDLVERYFRELSRLGAERIEQSNRKR